MILSAEKSWLLNDFENRTAVFYTLVNAFVFSYLELQDIKWQEANYYVHTTKQVALTPEVMNR